MSNLPLKMADWRTFQNESLLLMNDIPRNITEYHRNGDYVGSEKRILFRGSCMTSNVLLVRLSDVFRERSLRHVHVHYSVRESVWGIRRSSSDRWKELFDACHSFFGGDRERDSVLLLLFAIHTFHTIPYHTFPFRVPYHTILPREISYSKRNLSQRTQKQSKNCLIAAAAAAVLVYRSCFVERL